MKNLISSSREHKFPVHFSKHFFFKNLLQISTFFSYTKLYKKHQGNILWGMLGYRFGEYKYNIARIYDCKYVKLENTEIKCIRLNLCFANTP